MTHARRLSPILVILLIAIYNEIHAQPIKRVITRKPAIKKEQWDRNNIFPPGGIVLVREGGLQISETPPTMQHYTKGHHMSVAALNHALRTIPDVFEHKETSGLESRVKTVLAKRIQALRNYVQRVHDIRQSRDRAPRMDEEGEYVGQNYPHKVEISDGKMMHLYLNARSRKRKIEDVDTSKLELSKLLLYLIDHKIEITPIIRRTISYWKILLTAYWESFDYQKKRRRESKKTTTDASAASTNDGQATHEANQALQSQQPMGASSHDLQSSQPMASGNQDRTVMSSNNIVDPTSKPPISSFF